MSTIDKIKDKLHMGKKSHSNEGEVDYIAERTGQHRESIDEELAAMSPQEREAYLKEFEDAEKTGEAKKGSLIDKLIARGNKRTEDQLAEEQRQRESLTAGQAPSMTK
ncbi:hypothetical protein DM02DRAFT_610370 [Periconia macrospinosa]|uniref:Uncharacterized protein n=1 Tax=Periconia macrospinosa TaxID=97972 RepID=A0A2V1E7I5_9PLEO|nr:hypothetical protein DM02DRAFT_610370 [Periconia macrospinosa]